MPKFNIGDKVKIVSHPTKAEYCGQKGKIATVGEGHRPNTRGIGSSNRVPEVGKQWKYAVQIESHPSGLWVTDLLEDWLELLD